MSSSSQAPESWISAFCSLVGHEYFAEVSEDFIEDDFNLTGLQSQVPMYKEALEMILDVEPEDASDEEEEEEEEDEDEDDDEMQDGIDVGRGYRRDATGERRHYRMPSDQSVIESSAEMLYGLIHQRFITSRPGIQQMAEKYELNHFGHCPRVFCHGAKVLPVGCSDIPGQETVKLFCPSCLDVYSPPNSRFQTVDGAFFGTTFGCLFFMTFPDLDVGGQQRPIPAVSSHSGDPSAASSPLTTSSLDRSAGPATTNTHARTTGATNGSTNPTATAGNATVLPTTTTALSNLPSLSTPDQINGVAPRNLAPGLGASSMYEPRIYGFRVSEMAKTGPRMKWLRTRPDAVNELDETYWWHRIMNTDAGALRRAKKEAREVREGSGVEDVVMRGGGDAAAVAVEDGMEVEEDGEAAAQQRKVKEKAGLGEGSGAGGTLVNGGDVPMPVRVGDEG